jgi:ATP-dependent DNA helicase RecG
LRGRVGRGATQSSCVLLYQAPLSELARQRLGVMRETNDGFVIAERDLALRGPGELLGTRQTGEVGFRIADLSRHAHELPMLQSLAERILQGAPQHADALIQRWIGHSLKFAGA